eukprot:3265661-Amphidinium_carterae.1
MEVSDDDIGDDDKSDHEDDSDCLSEEESLGFGSQHDENREVPERARRALSFARSKPMSRPDINNVSGEFDGRVSNVEAVVGRMEALMATMLAQQQQQQNFMQQVQAHLTQQAVTSQAAFVEQDFVRSTRNKVVTATCSEAPLSSFEEHLPNEL